MKIVGKEDQARDSLTTSPPVPCSLSDTAAFVEVVHAASEAVTGLADRLNALALRVALMGGVAANLNTEPAFESYLGRLYALVNSAGDQMRRIQKLLQVLKVSTFQLEFRQTPVNPPLQPADQTIEETGAEVLRQR